MPGSVTELCQQWTTPKIPDTALLHPNSAYGFLNYFFHIVYFNHTLSFPPTPPIPPSTVPVTIPEGVKYFEGGGDCELLMWLRVPGGLELVRKMRCRDPCADASPVFAFLECCYRGISIFKPTEVSLASYHPTQPKLPLGLYHHTKGHCTHTLTLKVKPNQKYTRENKKKKS